MTDLESLDGRATVLRRRLIEHVAAAGTLRSPAWRSAVGEVPRHVFLPEFFRRVDGGGPTLWEPVSAVIIGVEAWLELVYSDEYWVTQLDDGLRPSDVDRPRHGSPSCSSSMPSLVVAMLEHLDIDVDDEHHVLEIGTGTGYSTALMCARLGDANVTSIEVDAVLAALAARALRQEGHRPSLVTGDGMTDHPPLDNRPFDRVISTCAVRRIPTAWVRQTRPGGMILTPVDGWLGGCGLARLTVTDNHSATGRFLPDDIGFMLARTHRAPSFDHHTEVQAAVVDATPRPARYGPEIFDDWQQTLLAQLAVPTSQHVAFSVDGGDLAHYVYDHDTGSVAQLTLTSDGAYRVREAGPVRLWDQIEAAIGGWQNAGTPPIEKFQIRLDHHGQTIHIDGTDLTWTIQ